MWKNTFLGENRVRARANNASISRCIRHFLGSRSSVISRCDSCTYRLPSAILSDCTFFYMSISISQADIEVTNSSRETLLQFDINHSETQQANYNKRVNL